MTIYRGNHWNWLKNGLLVAVVMVVAGAAGQSVKADPLTFSNARVFQNNSTTQVDLLSSPLGGIVGPNLSFRVDINGTLPAGGTDVLQVTFNEAGYAPQVQTYQIPLFGSVDPPFTLFFSFVSQGASPQGSASALTIDLLNSSPDFIIPVGPNEGQWRDSYTYSFNVVQPVPEPATLLAFGSGLAFVLGRRRRNLL